MSSLKRKRNLLDDKQKREIISYAKENPKFTQQIADILTIKWDFPINANANARSKNVPLTDEILKEKAKHSGDETGVTDFNIDETGLFFRMLLLSFHLIT